MPTLVIVNTFAAGVLVSSDWNDNLYDPTATNGSFEIINGHLDTVNMDGTDWPEVLAEQVQRDAYGLMGFVAATANLDYFNSWFNDIDTENDLTSDTPTRALPIPGGNATFFVPYAAMVVLTWTVFWTNISDDADEKTLMHLYIDDALTATQRRDVQRTSTTSANGVWGRAHDGRIKNRYWTGHHTLELAKGYHTAGLRIIADAAVPQSRVWARSFRYIIFKKDATWG